MTSDRCSACGSPLAPDQRYCVECGERRGTARFALPPPVSPAAATESQDARRPRISSSATLIAGVGTLLLAMGIGVLIGQSGNASAQRPNNPSVQVVTVGGGGGGVAASTSPRAVAATKPRAKSTKSHKSSSRSITATTATTATVQAAPPPTVTIGAPGHGAGYQNGHFTGNFFGP